MDEALGALELLVTHEDGQRAMVRAAGVDVVLELLQWAMSPASVAEPPPMQLSFAPPTATSTRSSAGFSAGGGDGNNNNNSSSSSNGADAAAASTVNNGGGGSANFVMQTALLRTLRNAVNDYHARTQVRLRRNVVVAARNLAAAVAVEQAAAAYTAVSAALHQVAKTAREWADRVLTYIGN